MFQQKTLTLFIAGLFCLQQARAQSPRPIPEAYAHDAKINYVRSWDVVAPEQSSVNLNTATSVERARMTTQYLDGLGRPIQTVVKEGSHPTGGTAKDAVSAVEYDIYGKEVFKYLSFAANSLGGATTVNDGLFKRNPFQQQASFSAGQHPGESFFYSETRSETSPLGRLDKALPVGDSWAGADRGSSVSYWNNTALDKVKIWNVTNSTTLGVFGTYAVRDGVGQGVGFYAAGELSKTIATDEAGNQVVEFKDKEGKIILKKVQLVGSDPVGAGSGHAGWLCTYYIYDALGQLRCVIQPRGVEYMESAGWDLGTTLLAEQCFRYEYDSRGRMIMKKVPGAAEIWMIYDQRDRLIMTQDGKQRSDQMWMYTKYDELNRATSSGYLAAHSDLAYHSQQAAANTAYPVLNNNFEELTNIYYDRYERPPGHAQPLASDRYSGDDGSFLAASQTNYPFPQPLTQTKSVLGLVTGTRTKVLGSSQFLYLNSYYDDHSRVLQTQSLGLTGSNTVTTQQYNYSGQVLVSYVLSAHTDISLTHGIHSRFDYDQLGRLAQIRKTVFTATGIGNTGEKLTLRNEYDAVGQLKIKKLGTRPGSSDPVETLNYDYNIRGWMLGANRNYLKDQGTTGFEQHYFGFDLGYDKNGVLGAYAPQYSGNIGGSVWRSKGDGERRKYSFTYDPVNRLTGADFKQYVSGTGASALFDLTAGVNFSVKDLSFDANGNIITMKQHGLMLNGSPLIDELTYAYKENNLSNKLGSVTESLGINSQDYKLGDFTDKNRSGDDYEYDVKGNLLSDKNKKINNIIYNHLNLPSVVSVLKDDGVTLKGTITYTYDASGMKLKKTTEELGAQVVLGNSTHQTNITTTTSYLSELVYERKDYSNDDLASLESPDRVQFLSQEEGRIRFQPGFGSIPAAFHFDYMIKDHLGNVRMVLTDQVQKDVYPAVEFENATTAASVNYYEGADIHRTTRSGSASGMEQLLRKSTGSVGVSKLLKVMSGDKIEAKVDYFIPGDNLATDNSAANGLNSLLNSLLGVFSGSGAPGTFHGQGSAITNNLGTPAGPLSQALQTQNAGSYSPMPKAYLNILFFDEQFKFVSQGSEVVPVSQIGTVHELARVLGDAKEAPKNGYAYIYVSNESDNLVYFDNFHVMHERSPILEETHYYPFGLTMSGISSRATNGLDNKFDYNGKEKQEKEFVDGSGLDEYDHGSRFYNVQIGRWNNIDPLSDEWERYSPYTFTLNNPILNVDPNGEDVYLFYAVKYKKEEDNRMFMQAAITRAFDLIASGEVGEGDIISLNMVSDLAELESSVEEKTKELSAKYGKTREFGIWSHAGTDGPIGGTATSQNALEEKQMTLDGWSQINFHWASRGSTKAGFYGCNTGRAPDGGDQGSFSTELSARKNMKNVFVWGQSTSSYPSMYTDMRESTSAMRDGYFSHPTYMVAAEPLKIIQDRIFGGYLPTKANPMRVSRNGKGATTNDLGQPYYQPGRKRRQ